MKGKQSYLVDLNSDSWGGGGGFSTILNIIMTNLTIFETECQRGLKYHGNSANLHIASPTQPPPTPRPPRHDMCW